MREWLKRWLIELLDLDRISLLEQRAQSHEDALAEARRELRKDIAGVQQKRDYSHPAMNVVDWETAQAIELQKLNAEAAKTRS